MMPSRISCAAGENPLALSWQDSAWIPMLNTSNIMAYFSERSNPFYDRTCNNEIVKMQRLSLDQLTNMTGLEYVLLHVQEPILYVIRKQHRHSPAQATPLADYYIIAGIVYQAPDLASVFNSRILSCVNHLQSAFEESMSYSRYHPSRGYSWEMKPPGGGGAGAGAPGAGGGAAGIPKKDNPKEEPNSLFQRQRVDMLLVELTKKFPLPHHPPQHHQTHQQQPNKTNAAEADIKAEPREVKTEKIDSPSCMKPPPEKKPRLG